MAELMEVLGHYLAIFKASGSRRAVAKKKVRGWKVHAVSPTTAISETIFKIAFLSDARKRVGTPKSRFRRLRPHTLLLIKSLYITSK